MFNGKTTAIDTVQMLDVMYFPYILSGLMSHPISDLLKDYKGVKDNTESRKT